jgi:hypothetical protein
MAIFNPFLGDRNIRKVEKLVALCIGGRQGMWVMRR